MRTDLNLPLAIDRDSPDGIRTQIVGQLRSAIRDGLLRPQDPLPSSRVLAARLGVARATVTACYEQLEGEGWLHSEQGSGTFVTDAHQEAALSKDAAPVADEPPGTLSLRPGDIDPRLVDATMWRRAWRSVTPSSAPAEPAGLASLRTELAGYLGSSRGLLCRPEEIVVCSGTNEALLLLAFAFGWIGDTVAVEDPGYLPLRALLEKVGVTPVAVDMARPDEVPDDLAALSPKPAAVCLTPSHQYPLGHRMSVPTRERLLEWARSSGTVLVEDDYDGEFRYDVPPLSSLAGLDPAAPTVYLGTLSKVLDPGLRLAYLRVPPALLPAVLDARTRLGSSVSTPSQQVLVELLRSGELARHIARVRRTYADRRRAALRALEAIPAIRAVHGIEAGLHVVVDLAPGISAADVVDRAAARGLLLADLDEFRFVPDPQHPALVVGYGTHAPAELRRAIGVLADCLDLRLT